MRSPLGVRVAQANEKLEWTEHEFNCFPGIQDIGRDYVTPGRTSPPPGRQTCTGGYQSVTRLPFVSRFSMICTLLRPVVSKPVSWMTWSALPLLPKTVITVSEPEAILI